MKTLKKLLVMALVSVVIATGIFFINSTVIKNSFADKVLEILVLAIPVFIVLALLLYVNKALVKSVRGIKNKKPSGEGGL
ncbi:hypothetical protein AMR72_12980 [Flavobacterium psychrophilum]|nr:hypothetical protein AMR72_12980 [Flavobacterium psychrophilum]AOE53355.1 hypothetical protein ALW18_12970 [Flavobacterium psychrophilum]